jgi:polar amino acid transport system substrate-binding protein
MKYRKMFFSEEKNQKTFGLSAWPKGWVASPLAAPGTGKKKLEIALKNDIQPHYFLSRPRAFQLCAVGSGRKVRIWLIISLIVCGLIGSTGGRCAEISLCADAWCPYNCVPGSSRPGMAVEIAQDIFGAAGDQVVYQELNWARCVEDARSGRFTGIIGAIPSDAPDFTFPKVPIGHSGDAYAVRKGDDFKFDGAASLNGRVLGVIRSYSFSGPIGAYIAAHATDGKVEFVSGDAALLKNLDKLVAGRVDVVLDDRNVMLHSIKELGWMDRLHVVDGLNDTPVYIAFSPKAPDPVKLAAILDAGILRLRASGQLAQILARYDLKDEP